MNPAYGKVITTETYYDGVNTNTRSELEISVLSDRENVLKDLIDHLTPLTSGKTHRLNIDICVKQSGQWQLVIKSAI